MLVANETAGDLPSLRLSVQAKARSAAPPAKYNHVRRITPPSGVCPSPKVHDARREGLLSPALKIPPAAPDSKT
jgi:hypothetical protein